MVQTKELVEIIIKNSKKACVYDILHKSYVVVEY